MAILKLRDLGKYGVIRDLVQFDIPLTAWTTAKNVRFVNNAIRRGPVFRRVVDLETHIPTFVDGIDPLSGNDYILVGMNTGRIYLTQVDTTNPLLTDNTNPDFDTLTDITPAGFTNTSAYIPHTSCFLGDVYYINREDHEPWGLPRTSATLSPLTGWNATWRTKALRSYGGMLIALGVTKGAYEYPTMVKWSDYAVAGSFPNNWDEASTTSSAGENVLADMRNPIVDGVPLRDKFIIYSSNEVWVMDQVGGSQIFEFRRLFDNVGAMNVNCAVEVSGRHYVFGYDDIYVHDGVQKKSISLGRVREYVFRTIDRRFMDRCFVVHNSLLNEVLFCYVTEDDLIHFRPNQGCNRAVAYDYLHDTWTIYDLPHVFSAGNATLNTGLTYARSGTVTFAEMGGSFLDKEDPYKKNTIFVGRSDDRYGLGNRIYVFEPYESGNVSLAVDSAATAPIRLEKTGIDLDEVDAEIRGYKNTIALYPQGRVSDPTKALEFEVGATDYADVVPFFQPAQGFTGGEGNYKIDTRMAGRYLALKVNYDSYKDFSLSGLDFDVIITGDR